GTDCPGSFIFRGMLVPRPMSVLLSRSPAASTTRRILPMRLGCNDVIVVVVRLQPNLATEIEPRCALVAIARDGPGVDTPIGGDLFLGVIDAAGERQGVFSGHERRSMKN